MRAPPPFFAFASEAAFVAQVRLSLPECEQEAVSQLLAGRLPPVTSTQALALATGFSPRFLGAMIRKPDRYYRRFSIRHGRGTREIAAPRIALKLIQHWFGYHLARAIGTPEHVHGFVPGRSIVTAARVHSNASWVVCVDIHRFFPSVSNERVTLALEELAYPGHGIWTLVGLTTLAGSLPQGSPASPPLSNLVFKATDVALAQWAQGCGVRLTRYADDIAISGVGDAPDLNRLAEQLGTILAQHSWTIAEEKTRITTGASPRRVLGLLVDGAEPRLSRRYRHKLRMMEHMVSKEAECQKRMRFQGHLAFANSVRPMQRDE